MRNVSIKGEKMFLRDKKGIMLIACYLVVVVLTILGSAFMVRSVSEKRIAERERDSLQAFYLAEAGIDRVARELYNGLRNDRCPLGNCSDSDFNWFNNLVNVPPPFAPYTPYAAPQNASLSPVAGTYSVVIGNVIMTPSGGQADVTLVSTGDVNNTTRTITSVIRYRLESSEVFNHPYFVNNLGWFWGGGITANGDIRANGNFSFGGNPEVNGDIYASRNPDLWADGDITGNSRNVTINQYRNQADTEARPTDPTANPEDANGNGILDPGEDTNGNGILDDFDYPDGYDGTSARFPNQEVLEMPYLGDLQTYKNLAVSEGGTISQGGVALVNAVYGDDAAEVGPDGIGATPDDDSVVLIGTAANPININGPVVIEGDVIIRGVVQGQGIIYSGRNTHIIGDITYQNPPAWPKPDTDPTATDAVNNTRDFLGLATKGNIVIGDYTRTDWKTVKNYLKPPFTQAYDTDATDAVIGYDSDGNPLNGYRFDGDYTSNDGGVKDDGSGEATNRKYYESSLSDDFINTNGAPSNQIRRIDAVTYTNHAFAGRVGAFTMNGTLVARDEAIIYSGSIRMNYDIRAKSKGDDFHLPSELALPQTMSWKEN